MNKVVIAVVPGWAVGGGRSLHVVCDMTVASKEHAIFKQTDADVASWRRLGSAYLARQVGQNAPEIFFLGAEYSAQEAYKMGMVNKVVPHEELEQVAYEWAREIMTRVLRPSRCWNSVSISLTTDWWVSKYMPAKLLGLPMERMKL